MLKIGCICCAEYLLGGRGGDQVGGGDGLKVDSMVYMVMGLLFRKMPVELKEYNYNLPHSTTKDTFK